MSIVIGFILLLVSYTFLVDATNVFRVPFYMTQQVICELCFKLCFLNLSLKNQNRAIFTYFKSGLILSIKSSEYLDPRFLPW